MSKGKNRVASNSSQKKISNRKAEREADLQKERKKRGIIIGIVIVAIIAVSALALLQKGDDGVDDAIDDGIDDNGVAGKYGMIVEGNPTIMDIGSTSCIPCQQLQPVLSSLGQKYDGIVNIKFYDCWNTAEGAEMATSYKLTVIPTLVFLDGQGNEVGRMMGYNSQSTIETKMVELGWI